MRTAGCTVWQALTNNFQTLAIFFQIHTAQVRCYRTIVTIDLFVGFLGAANHHFLIVNTHAVQLLQVMFPTLHEYIAAASIDAIFDNSDFTTRCFTRRVFSAINKATEVTLFHPAETVDLFFDINAVAKRFHGRLRNGEVHVMAQRENMDQYVILGGRRQAFTVRDKVLQLFRAHAAAQFAPGVVAKSDYRAQMRIREFRFKGCQLIGKCFAGRSQSLNITFYVGFNPNRRTAMFWQNATLNLRHCSS